MTQPSDPGISTPRLLARVRAELVDRPVWRQPGWVEAHLVHSAPEAPPEVAVVHATHIGACGSLGIEVPVSVRRVLAVSEHPPQVVALDLGGARMDRWITCWGVLDREEETLWVREVAPGVSARDLQRRSAASLFARPDLGPMKLGPV